MSATGAKYLDIKATQEQLYANSLAAAGELRRAEAVKAGAVADVESAARAVANAKAKVAADRQVITSEVARLESVQAALASEKLLEAQRLQAQISDVGRQQSIARMAELRLAEVAITNQLTAAEAKLATTTLATSAQVTAAINQQTVAKEALAVANTQVNATQIAATASMGAWFSASTAMGASMLALRNAASGVLRMAAGWPGLILTVGALALSFIDFGDKAEEGAGKAANAFEDASTRIRQASRSMLPENLSTQSYDQLQDRLKGLQAELKETEKLQDRFQKGVDDKSDVPFETSLDASKEKADALRLAIQSVQKELNSSRLASDKEGSTYLKNLEKQAVVAGKLTEVEKLRAQIAAGAVKFSPDDEKKALAAAEAIDKANKALKESKAGDKDSKALSRRFEDMAEGYQRQIELINTSTDKRKNATEVEKLAFEISAGKLEGVNAQQRKRLEGLAAELDALKKLKQAKEDDKAVSEFGASVKRQLDIDQRALDAPLLNAYDTDEVKQRALELLAIEQNYQDQLEDLRQRHEGGDVSDSAYERETKILTDALEDRLAKQQDYYDKVDQLQQNGTAGFISGFASQAEAAMDLYSSMRDVGSAAFSSLTDMLTEWAETGKLNAQDFAATFIQSIGHSLLAYAAAQVAMAGLSAFTAMIGVPYVGPAIAPGAAIAATAAAGVLMTGVGSALSGQAHAGIDNIPREGTWLLDGGERVLSPAQNKDLTGYLQRVNAVDAASKPSGGSMNVEVHNYAPAQVDVQQDGDRMKVFIREAKRQIAGDLARGNGDVSKALSAGWGVKRAAR
ncbi:phage tail tape measure protein [Pseudomonas sp. NBRC 111127]|uniref:phage tail tape measure protein n=1 Tax=Pseudomonas sp. NBRC 111127 TaxID=1661042 RepID=UPI00210D72D7|nr:phage tail tape measure protein [Pseudomonas sp. NBRC 111127]